MLEIKNKKLMMVLNFLRNDLVTTESIENIHRMRVVKNLEEQAEQLEEERVEIIKKFADKDENGELIQSENGEVTVQDAQSMNSQISILFDETYSINDSNLKTAIQTIANLVMNFKGELKGDSGEAHYILVEELEKYSDKEA